MNKLNIEYVSYYVYEHIFPNGKKYIGITSQLPNRRWRDGKGYKSQEMLTRAINKYGWGNITHIVLHSGLTKEEAELKEIELIREYKTNNRKYGYNIENGGGSSKGHHLSKKTREKMSKSRMGEKNWIYGKHLSAETKLKLSIAHKGKCDIEAVRRGAKKRMGKNAFNSRRVVQFSKNGELIREYDSLADAYRETNVRTQDIYNCCVGRQKSAKNYIWKYSEQVAI